MFNRLQLLVLTVLFSFIAMPVFAGGTGQQGEVETFHEMSAADLIAQNNLTRVTGVEVNQTAEGLELILKTVAGSERLVPLILPEGNDLVIDILDATLAFSIRNGVTELNPAPGINRITVSKANDNSIRVRIAGANQTPSAEVLPGRDTLDSRYNGGNPHNALSRDLVLSVTPEDTTAEQEPDEEIEVIATGEAEEEGGYVVDDAGVTRTDTPIIDTPASVQVIPRQVFEDQGATRFSEALRSAAGVIQGNSSRNVFTTVSVRGFDTSETLLRNGIPEVLTALQPPRDLSNVERLEVLSGPASIVGGQISPGGVINIVTKQPLSSPLYEVSASYGSFDTVEGAFDFSGPLNSDKTLSYRLNTSIYHSETSADADDVEIDTFFIAPVISWQIAEKTKLTLEGQYLDGRYPDDFGFPAIGTVLDNPNGEIPRENFLSDPSFSSDDRQILQVGYDLEHNFSEDWSLRQTFRYSELERSRETNFSTELQDDLRTLDLFAASDEVTINNYQATASLTGKFDTGKIDHQLLFGIDYVYEDFSRIGIDREINSIDIFEPVYEGVGEIIPDSTFGGEETTDGLGIYLQDQLQMFDERLILVLGGRLDFVGSSSEGLDESEPQESQDNDAFSPRVGILYKIADNVSVYGSFSRSFEQEVGTSFDNEIFEPSRGTQFEIGVKTNWLDNRLSTTLALFDLTRSNVTTEDPENPNFDIQTGEQSSQGIELVTTGEITPSWNIIASYAYNDAEITEDNEFDVGNKLRNIPENSASLWTTYSISQGS